MLISPDGLASLCTYVIDEKVTIDPEATRIYMNGEDLNWEFNVEHLAQHPKKFQLIWANTDRPFTWIMFSALRHKLLHVYAVNSEVTDPIVTRIPLGFKHPEMLAPVVSLDRSILCYMNVGGYMDKYIAHKTARVLRDVCRQTFEGCDWVTKEDNVNQNKFYERMMKSKFVLCPMGVGMDTWRFYEAAWYGATPIVLHSALDDLYEKFGALIVNQWSDVTKELLERCDPRRQPLDKSVFNISEYIPNADIV